MAYAKKKVLIIDDEPDTLYLLKETLEENHFECLTALTPVEGLEKARSNSPDVIILDLMLPQMTGYGFLRELKHDPKTKQIPVVVLTSLKDNEVARGAMDLGAVSYLTKSCPTQELVSTVEEYALS